MQSIVAAIQMTSTGLVAENLKKAENLLQQAAEKGATLVVLPEMFALLGKGEVYRQKKRGIQEHFGAGPIQDFLSKMAQRYQLWIVGGTLPITSDDPDKPFLSSLLFDNHGKIIARYDKIHLFDVTLSPVEFYRESESSTPGQHLNCVETPLGRLGMSVCYDLRFAELFRGLFMHGAEIIVVPSAFTVPTGKAHWEVLLRARAIENECYVIAAAQWGRHSDNRETYGHSCIIDPNGEVIAQLAQGEGVIVATLDRARLEQQRRNIPVRMHQKIFPDLADYPIVLS